jgi:hypothetical protein
MILDLAAVKVFLEETTTDFDTQIEAMLNGLNRFIEKFLNKSIDGTIYHELYDGNGEKKLLLDNYPITSVSILSDDIDKDSKVYNSVISTDEILIHGNAGIIELYNQSFCKSQKNIYIKYTAGYTSQTIEPDLQMALYEMISKKWEDYKDKRYGMVTKTVLDENVSFSLVDVTKQQREILLSYRGIPRRKGVTVNAYSAAS